MAIERWPFFLFCMQELVFSLMYSPIMMSKKNLKGQGENEQLEEILQYVSDRCREESEEANSMGFGNGREDIINEALGMFFEKMSDIIEEAIDSIK